MKTRNSKLQKTGLTSLTNLIVLSAAVLLLNVQATATEKNTRLNTGTEAFAEILISERDAEMNLENWMLNKRNFFPIYELEAESEASLEVESWMTAAINFTASSSLETVTEEALNIEEWMINENNFSPVITLETEMEEPIALENWMMDTKNFNATIHLENDSEEVLNVEQWMLNESTFYTSPALETDVDNTLELEAWMVSDTTFSKTSTEEAKTETFALASTETNKSLTTIEYKDAASGVTFLFILAEVEEPELQLENWMFDKRHWNRKLETK